MQTKDLVEFLESKLRQEKKLLNQFQSSSQSAHYGEAVVIGMIQAYALALSFVLKSNKLNEQHEKSSGFKS